jgi:malonyl-CoA O-methyltransferase
MRDGRLPVSVEVVYGHAWAGESRRRALTGETLVPVAELRRRSSR